MTCLSPVVDRGVSKVMNGEVFNPRILTDILVDRPDMSILEMFWVIFTILRIPLPVIEKSSIGRISMFLKGMC
jgi:hypothetical protein